jgi:N-6 DNA methylase
VLLDRAHAELGWPPEALVITPPGAGAKIYAEFARQKIGESLKRLRPDSDIRVGVLSYDPNSDGSEPPLALVCEFRNGASEPELQEAHRLAWNFSRTALLITLEPTRVMAWTCLQDPTRDLESRRIVELPTQNVDPETSEQSTLRDLLHWVGLVTGKLLKDRAEAFPPSGRADVLLLENLRDIRRKLLGNGLPTIYCHDLLARIIFTQFLFHRKDTDGNPFFRRSLLDRLHQEGTLGKVHADLPSILSSKRDTYALFRWMDDRFNGDLFPGEQGQSESEVETAWKSEYKAVTVEHLAILRDFISGDVSVASGQISLWPYYSFDIIPLEFISSIYEEFLNEERDADKAYYTPAHLVDYILDSVLPWDSEEWNVKVIDPACGSGIFLVKAFQRLVHRWRKANGRSPRVGDLKPILSNNLFGVDKNREAIRVASFSLFLAMADAIEPKHYVTREKVFPKLRGSRLVASDFFSEDVDGFATTVSEPPYDLAIGNPPWGDGSITATSAPANLEQLKGRRQRSKKSLAEVWALTHTCPVANRDIGPLFLAKAARLVRDGGMVAMIQPASTLLLQRAPRARELRRYLFERYTFVEVTNLVPLRRVLFNGVIGPACIVTLRTTKPNAATQFSYITPKPGWDPLLEGVAVEPQDVAQLSHAEAVSIPFVWSVLALGGRRDLQLISRLANLPTLKTLEEEGKVLSRLGVIPGDQKKRMPEFKNLPFFFEPNFPHDVLFDLNAATLPRWREPRVASTYDTNPEAFRTPQLLVKLSPSTVDRRFRAVRVRTESDWGVVCKKTYLSVRDYSSDARHVNAACLFFNSRFAAYFLRLTGSRALYNTEMLTEELKELPLVISPRAEQRVPTFSTVDALTAELLHLNSADRSLMDDFLSVTLPDALRRSDSIGRLPTRRNSEDGTWEPDLTNYVATFTNVVKTTFGKEKSLGATIYCEPRERPLPLRLVTLELTASTSQQPKVQTISSQALLDELTQFHRSVLQYERTSVSSPALAFTRVAFLFHSSEGPAGKVHKLSIVKPDERRYWTSSLAMRDADQLSMAIFRAAGLHSPKAQNYS